MSEQAGFALRGRNPDVLTCIANLSNDEVFTPPEFAGRMLDLVAEAWAADNDGANLWANPKATFLDPFTKSGVFLREITKRLIEGLANEMPDLDERVDHILTTQVYGIAITTLTSMLARRSVYCSKYADGEHSVATSFDNPSGNIWFERVEHSWVGATEWRRERHQDGGETRRPLNGRCSFCGASQVAMDRGAELETHAYAFIHTDNIKARIGEMFGDDVQFDVIIGNPPYQTTGGGGGSNDSPIYNLFVEQAMRLEPRYLSMVIPSRWMAGGRGLSDFRATFLGDQRVRSLTDYENAKDAFPTVGIGGGVCYFLWDRDAPGPCNCTYHRNGAVVGPYSRRLDEFDVFLRDARGVEILRKVIAAGGDSFEALVSGDTPFGLATNFKDYAKNTTPTKGQLRLYANVGTTRVTGAVDRQRVAKNTDLIEAWKLFLPVAGSGREREKTGVDLVLGPPIVGEPGSVCTQTYLAAGPFASEAEAESVQSYLRTRLVRFLVSLRKPAQHVFRAMYRWVPMQTWDEAWTDEKLYTKYGLTPEEISFIEAMIRPMAANIDG